MGNNHSEKYSFLKHANACLYFAKLDAWLKAGVHLQRAVKEHRPVVDFMVDGENFRSLKMYYEDLFSFSLLKAGEFPNEFYYLDYNDSDEKQNIVYKDKLEPRYIVIAIIMWFLHQKGEDINTIEDFLNALRHNFMAYETTFCRMITENKSTDMSEIQVFEDDEMKSVLSSAITQFKKLAWLEGDKNYFTILPAFKRIEIAYASTLNNIDSINQTYLKSLEQNDASQEI